MTPETEKSEQCEDCRYFLKPDIEYGETPEEYEKSYEVGDCRRYPPQIKPELNGYDHPEVYREGWCGEFKAIIKKDLKT